MVHPSNHRIKIRKQEQNERYGNRCHFKGCKATANLHYAHIIPTPISKISRGRGRKERYYDVENHEGHYVMMCEDHHRRFDHYRRHKKLDQVVIIMWV